MWKIAFGIFIKVLHFKAPWVRHLLRVQKERTSFLKPTTFDQWFWFYLNVFVKIKNSIFPQKYTKYGKIVEEKLFHFKEFYKFLSGHFFIAVIFLFINEKCYKKRPLVSKKKTIRNTKKKPDKIVYLKKTYFTSEHFLIGQVVFVLIVKSDIKNEKFYFAPNLCEIRKKCQEIKLFTSKISANYLFTIST